MKQPIVFWPTEHDEVNLAIIEATGLSGDEAIRAAISSLAADCVPAAWALSTSPARSAS